MTCDFCFTHRIYGARVKEIDFGGGYMHLSPSDRCLRVSEDPDGDIYLLRINYCPMCGRDLKEGA